MTQEERIRELIAKWRKEYPRRTAKMFNDVLDELEALLAESPAPASERLAFETWLAEIWVGRHGTQQPYVLDCMRDAFAAGVASRGA